MGTQGDTHARLRVDGLASTGSRIGRRWVARLLATAAALTLATAAGACGSDDGDAQAGAADAGGGDTTLRVGDLGSGNNTRALLEAAGELDDLPYELEWSIFPAGPQLIEAQRAGAVDLGYMANTPVVFARAAGTPVKIVAAHALVENESSDTAVLVPADSPIETVADLEGRKVGITNGTIMQYMLIERLEEAGLGYDDVEVALLPPTDGLNALDNGSIDAWPAVEPFVSAAHAKGDYREVTTGAGMTGRNGLVAREQALEDPDLRAAIEDFVARVARAQAWASENVDEWGEAYAKTNRLPAAVGKATQRRIRARYVPIDDAAIDAFRDQAEVFSELGLVEGEVDAEQAFDTRFNAVVAEAGGG